MAIEAPLSRYRRNNLKIYMVVCILAALWFGYDGYLNQKFIEEHTDEQGNANSTLVFNRVACPVFVGGALLLAAYFFAIRGRKVVAEENELVIAGKVKIPYDSIEKIDKTYYDDKGFFTIVYEDGRGKEAQRKLNNRSYDNLGAILDHLVTQIT
jgi:hypothetical protein